MVYKPALISGVLFALLGVTIGAFGAHYLKQIFSPETLVSFETGVRYQFYHSFALIITGILAKENIAWIKPVFYCFLTGIILFSGSIYALCILKSTMVIGLKGIGILTPIGGMFFITAWLLLFLSLLKSIRKN